MLAIVLCVLLIFSYRGDWDLMFSTIFVLTLMFIPSILKRTYQMFIPFIVRLWIVSFIFLTLFLGEIGRLYEYIPLWDKFLHLQSEFLLGASGYILIYILNNHEKRRLHLSPFFITLFAISFSLALGVIWEVIEFAVDVYFGTTWQNGNTDTMLDLIADGTGAIILTFIGYLWMNKHKRLPLTPWCMK
jgi:energy-coupling factor transporter transmembrane protein EcfT